MSIKIIHSNPYGPLTHSKLVDFINKYNISLPLDYIKFLLQYNGGQPVPSFFWIKLNEDGSNIYQFYGLYDDPINFSLETYAGEERYGIPRSLLPIGDDGTGNFICLGVSSVNINEVFFLDHEIHPYYDHESFKGISKIANSFTEFLQSLIENPE